MTFFYPEIVYLTSSYWKDQNEFGRSGNIFFNSLTQHTEQNLGMEEDDLIITSTLCTHVFSTFPVTQTVKTLLLLRIHLWFAMIRSVMNFNPIPLHPVSSIAFTPLHPSLPILSLFHHPHQFYPSFFSPRSPHYRSSNSENAAVTELQRSGYKPQNATQQQQESVIVTKLKQEFPSAEEGVVRDVVQW